MSADEITLDRLLGGRVEFAQLAEGYRAAIDPVLLAAALGEPAGEHVLDLGAGAGAASLCLAARVPDCRVTGLERDAVLVRLASENAGRNGFADRLTFVEGDVRAPPASVAPASFDRVMANPPYLEAARASPSPKPGRATSQVESDAPLEDWIAAALAFARPKGVMTFIHRADRLGDLLAAFGGKAGEVAIFPLWPMADGRPAKRVIVRARKGSAAPTRLMPGLVLHEKDGRFTDAAEAILRGAAALEF
ncbi:MAG TPA: methyltransferase [Alphaproteobacteria bacterium]|nr:methyltransferase [Alphaproteobacteria bacterium]